MEEGMTETNLPTDIESQVASEIVSSPVSHQQVKRDRIVILGRTQAGKTVFMASLYDACWNRGGSVQIEAIDGRTHKAMMESIETLRAGKWPSSTTGVKYLDMMVTVDGQSRPLISVDYPGEVFRKAFIDGLETEDVQELLDHIDRAAAVIVLVDPNVVVNAVATVSMDDNYGMAKAIERIRSWPGGEDVPISIVLTKSDKYQGQIDRYGGAVKFVRQYYPSLVQSASRSSVFQCSVVEVKTNGKTDSAVFRKFNSKGTVAPIHWIVNQLHEQELLRDATEKNRIRREMMVEAERLDEVNRERSTKMWIIGWVSFIVAFFLVAFITFIVVWPTES
tara:strand:- start:32763 stop:33767 length:1005 start_codon:yes stop_codon:yes gene_type:complete